MIEAYVYDNDFGRSVSVSIVRHDSADFQYVLRLSDVGNKWEKITQEGVQVAPSFTLEQQFARPLLDALSRHYSGAEDTRALRKDYDAERARVDKLTDHLIRTTS